MNRESRKAVRIFLTDTNDERHEAGELVARAIRSQYMTGIELHLRGVDGATMVLLRPSDARKLIDAIVEVLPC
jgi:hypothetical protein